MSTKSKNPPKVKSKAAGGDGDDIDRLVKANQAKQQNITVAGLDLLLQKWDLRTGMRLTGKMLKLLRTALKGITSDIVTNTETDNATKIAAIAAQDFDISELLEENYDDIVEILSVTVRKNNFDNETKARAWVEGLALDECIDLAAPIVEMNVRPLMGAVGKIGAILGGGNLASQNPAQKDAAPSTS